MSTERIPSVPQLLDTLHRLDIRLWLEGDELRVGGDNSRLTDELVQQLKGLRSELVTTLRAKATQDSNSLPAHLSFAQQRLWLLEQIPQESGVYHVPVAIRIRGYLDVPALTQALTAVMTRHEVLRTCYPAPDGEPIQSVLPSAQALLPVMDLRDHPAQQDAVQNILLESASTLFDLTQDSPLRADLLQLQDDEHVLAFTLHHIACDAWSLELLIAELAACYRAQLLGTSPALPSLSAQYADFARWQRNRVTGELLQSQADYWCQQLAGPLPVLDMPTDFPRPKIQQHDGHTIQFHLPAALVEQVRQLGHRHSASLFMTLLAAFKLLLSRYTGQQDLIVGTPVSNRQRGEFEGLIGLFVNTLVLRTRLNPRWQFGDLLDAVRRTTLDAMNHQDLPFEKLIDVLQPERDMSRSPLFQVKFRLENAPPATQPLPGLTLERLPQAHIRAKLDISLDLYETADGIVGGVEYNTSLFRQDSMERLAQHFRTLLQSIVEQPATPLLALPILSNAQQQQQLLAWNDTQKPWNRNTCFHYLFEDNAQEKPDNTALVFDNGLRRDTLSYDATNRRANQLAHWLREAGVGPETVVGICMDRSLDMIVSLLAVMKAGGAYLPLDANYPQERLAFMLADARVPVLLSHSDIVLPAAERRLNLNRDFPSEFPEDNPARVNTPQHLAYVIYTSGSTGLPKGVMIEHSGLVNLTEDKIRVCDVRAGDCVLQFFSFSFDASIPEIIMPLAMGGSLLLAPPALLLPGPDLRDLMLRNKVSHITMTPSALVSLPDAEYPDLRMVLVGGEAPAPDLIEKWCRGRVFINAYGPTETTVNASMVPCGNGHPLTATLLPSTNKQLHVLDANLQLLPTGAVGELFIGGVGLARGYLNRPDLTARQFVPNPFHHADSIGTSPTLYKTGDLAFYLPDGRIRLVGRADHQVKIRGFRVELGDVEHRLAAHPDVDAAVVIAVDDRHHGKRLAGFAVAKNSQQTAPAEMRQFIGEQLPSYMVPTTFHWLESLPLTPNGKIDNRALAQLADVPDISAAPIPPRTETERQISALFAEILGNANIGADTDFFEAGGHSLLATRLVSRLLEIYAVEITVMDLFEATTVAALALRIEHKLKLARLQSPVCAPAEDNEVIDL